MMDLDELRSVQSRERQTDSLQQLRESFYQDAGEFIQQLHRERERAAEEADDPWNAPEVTRLSDDIDTAEQTVEAIYERRVGKIVKMASLAAADMPTEDEGLTAEEQRLFDTLVDAIERNRANVEAVIDGEDPPESVPDAGGSPAAGAGGADSPAAAGDPTAEATGDATTGASDGATAPSSGSAESAPDPDGVGTPTDPATGDSESRPVPPEGPSEAPADPSGGESGVDAADLMSGDGPDETRGGEDDRDAAATDPSAVSGEQEDGRAAPPDERTGDGDQSAADSAGPPAADSASQSEADTADEGAAADASAVDRATVRITADVGEIFGVDERAYDLSTDDVVQLPEANAGPLVERDAAERLD